MINTDLSIQHKWIARRGFNNSFTLTFTNNGSAFNVSTYTFVVNLRRIGGTTNLLQLTQAAGITNGGASGIVTIQLTAAQGNTIDADSYYYEVNYTVSSLSYGLLHGTLDLLTQYNPENENNDVEIDVNLAGTDVNLSIEIAGISQSELDAALALKADLALDNGTYSTELTFNVDKDIYQDVTSPTFTLATSGNVNGVGIILRLNTPTSVTFPGNFEASANSAAVDPTKLNVFMLVFFTNWDGAGTDKVIYTNSLFTAI